MHRCHVHLAGWLPIPWALDEDLAWVQRSLDGRCRWTSLPFAGIIHAAWPAAVTALRPAALGGKIVVCQADNPPAFYLSTDGFAEAAKRVDLWIARSSEAEEQFRLLGLPVARVPYCVDPEIFRPLADREGIRRSLGLARDAFVIGNFHRDSEGADLRRPKLQKGPDIFLQIAREARKRVPQTTVLLAGPRRHWLLNALRAEGIPVVFAGEETGTRDDYPRNIVSRARLNELYQALDVCVVSSRWEGGPYSVLEALASGCALISTPVGTSIDVLPSECIFNSVGRAAELLEILATRDRLQEVYSAASARASLTHGLGAVSNALCSIYTQLPVGGPGLLGATRSAVHWLAGRIFRSPEISRGGAFAESAPALQAELENFDSRDCRTRDTLDALASRIRGLRAAQR